MAEMKAVPLVVIMGGLADHALADELVTSGRALHAKVASRSMIENIEYEAYRVSPTSYAWRSSCMTAPAFAEMKNPEELEDTPEIAIDNTPAPAPAPVPAASDLALIAAERDMEAYYDCWDWDENMKRWAHGDI